MTMALCLFCGELKFGALCRCEKCGEGSTGEMGIDIAFSDRRMPKKSLVALGRIVRLINTSSSKPQDLKFWVFLKYITVSYPRLLVGDFDFPKEVESEYSRIDFPLVKIDYIKQVDVNDVIDYLTGIIAKVIVSDSSWQAFGYKRRPRRGASFRRFANKENLDREDFIKNELLIMALVDVISAIEASIEYMEAALSVDYRTLILFGILDRLFTCKALQYSDEMLRYIEDAIESYRYADSTKRMEVLVSRGKNYLGAKSLPLIAFGAAVMTTYSMSTSDLVLQRSRLADWLKSGIPVGEVNATSNNYSRDHAIKLCCRVFGLTTERDS